MPTRYGPLAMLLMAVFACPVTADNRLELETTRAVVFKDGYALIVREGTATADADGAVFTSEVPDAAVLGCFWAFAHDAGVPRMRAELIETTSQNPAMTPCTSVADLLRANTGRPVTLVMESGCRLGDRLTGHVVRMLDGTAPLAPPAASRRSVTVLSLASQEAPNVGTTTQRIGAPGASLFEFEADGESSRRLIIPVSDVRSLAGAGFTDHYASRTRHVRREKRLTFDFGEQNSGRDINLTLMYFTNGLRWIPTYRLTGDLEEDGNLDLHAEIINEAEDLTGAALDLVVGVPNFRFRSLVSPMSMERTLRDTLSRAAPDLMGSSGPGRQDRQITRTMFTQRASEWRQHEPMESAGAMGTSDVQGLGAEESQDLFVYSVDSMSLARGARATVPLWSATIPLSHIYTLDLPIVRDTDNHAWQTHAESTDQTSPLRLSARDTWHQLRLRNTTDQPWTTGAALMMRGFLPLAQDLLTYTPAGASTLLPVTRAPGVRSSYNEQEVSRTPNAFEYQNHGYTVIRKRGTLRLANHLTDAAPMRVALSIGGRIESTSDEASVTVNDYRSTDWTRPYRHQINNHSDVTWELTLEPGESRELTFEFTFAIP